jgi:hypothetical protein
MDLKAHFDEHGRRLSPLLPANIKNFLIDIDGTICEDVPNEEPERMLSCKEIPGAKMQVNRWYDEGHIITFFTSRLETHRAYTERWLTEHGFKWHGIIFGKPRGGNYHLIDDRPIQATRLTGRFTELVKTERTLQVEVFKDDPEK